MKVVFEDKEQFTLIQQTESAEVLLLNQVFKEKIENEDKDSFILNVDQDVDMESLSKILIEFGHQVLSSFGIIIVVSKESLKVEIEKLGIDSLVYLPTLHEAEEAIFMNELEKQFKTELGE